MTTTPNPNAGNPPRGVPSNVINSPSNYLFVARDNMALFDRMRLALGNKPTPYSATTLRDALVAAVEPPKPVEPTNFAAVIDDANGQVWVRVGKARPWVLAGRPEVTQVYANINAISVLHTGLQIKPV